jgi:hypothetical protein
MLVRGKLIVPRVLGDGKFTGERVRREVCRRCLGLLGE